MNAALRSRAQALSRALTSAGRVAGAVIAAVVNPATLVAYLILGGPSAIVYGVYLLAGVGWAYIAGGVAAVAVAFIIARGA